MRRCLFVLIINDACAHDSYFVQRHDASSLLGLSPHEKCMSALCMSLYDVVVDVTCEYFNMEESSDMLCMK